MARGLLLTQLAPPLPFMRRPDMKTVHALSAAAILLLADNQLNGQSLEPTFEPPLVTPQSPQESSTYDSLPLSTGEELVTDVETDCEPVHFYSARLAFGVTLADYSINDGTTSVWSTEPTGVTRSEFALENPEGFGVRTQVLSLDREWELDEGPLEIRIATYYLDGFRRFVGENGELLLGGGLAFGSLKLDSPFEDTVHRFNGLGASLVGEGFYPFLRFTKTDIGVTGSARLALLGPLEDNFDGSQAILVDEVGVGLELRRRWGKHVDKMWFVRLRREYQNWSDLNTPFTFDQRIEATFLAVGFAW